MDGTADPLDPLDPLDPSGPLDPSDPSGRGRLIEVGSWASVAVFAATAVPAALGSEPFDDAAVTVTLVSFFAAMVVWLWALAAAAVRTAQGDDLAVGTLFLLEGPVPRRIRWSLYGALGVCIAVAVVTAAANPFGVLVPMLPIGWIGLWGARHQTFPPRRDVGAR